MDTKTRTAWAKKAATIAVLPVAVLGVTSCGEENVDPGLELENIDEEEAVDTLDSGPYNEVYDQSFWDELTIYFGEEVTLSAQVLDPVDAHGFTLAGMDETTVDPLLVLHDGQMQQLEPEQDIFVNGTVYEYLDIEEVENELGVDLVDALYEQWENDPYLLATTVTTDAPPAP